MDPAPRRGKKTSWDTFLNAHWEVLAAADFFTVEVWTVQGLVMHYVLFFIELARRSVHIAGITINPNDAFMLQVARNLTDLLIYRSVRLEPERQPSLPFEPPSSLFAIHAPADM
ncbi:MAG: hypothetical protein M3436_15165 [Pseudomonadota bacterium]|nr:hypothetical protein [Pseudomonadota bacterium]